MSIFGFKKNRTIGEGASASGTSCLLIDYENLAISLKEIDGLQSLDLSPILAVAKNRSPNGRLDVVHAYADWRHFSHDANALVRLGVKTVQAPSFRYQGKNATDIHMAVEATDLLHLHPELQVFFLASGDSDFTPLVQLLRSRGKQVIGIGIQGSVSRQLQTVCDDFILYDELMENFGNRVEDPPPPNLPETAKVAYKPRTIPASRTRIVSESPKQKTRTLATRESIPAKPAPSSYSVASKPVGNNGNGSGIESLREAIGLDPTELLTSTRLKQLLPMATEAWHEAKPQYAPQMKRALQRRSAGQLSSFEAQVISSLLERTGGLGLNSWLVIGGSDGDLLFDLLLHASQRTLNSQGRTDADDPSRLGEVLLKDSIESPELRMRLVRGRSAVQKHQQMT